MFLAAIAFPRDFGLVHPVEIARAAVTEKRFVELCDDPADQKKVSRLMRFFQGRGFFRRWLRADNSWLAFIEPMGRDRHRRYSITARKERCVVKGIPVIPGAELRLQVLPWTHGENWRAEMVALIDAVAGAVRSGTEDEIELRRALQCCLERLLGNVTPHQLHMILSGYNKPRPLDPPPPRPRRRKR